MYGWPIIHFEIPDHEPGCFYWHNVFAGEYINWLCVLP